LKLKEREREREIVTVEGDEAEDGEAVVGSGEGDKL
jgi:hypothetical protein